MIRLKLISLSVCVLNFFVVVTVFFVPPAHDAAALFGEFIAIFFFIFTPAFRVEIFTLTNLTAWLSPGRSALVPIKIIFREFFFTVTAFIPFQGGLPHPQKKPYGLNR